MKFINGIKERTNCCPRKLTLQKTNNNDKAGWMYDDEQSDGNGITQR